VDILPILTTDTYGINCTDTRPFDFAQGRLCAGTSLAGPSGGYLRLLAVCVCLLAPKGQANIGVL